ncbi:MAG: hypothetical protein JW870_07340 [Candidatus Delongbacteria bacterium]|nr:hypothetical protein [Candidatus Delongbacteria bacterium]
MKIKEFLLEFSSKDLIRKQVLNTKRNLLNSKSVEPLLKLMRQHNVTKLIGTNNWYIDINYNYRNDKSYFYPKGNLHSNEIPRLGVVFDNQNNIINPYYEKTAQIKENQKVPNEKLLSMQNSDDSTQLNPKWHRKEIILALDLYFRLDSNDIKSTNPKIIELSKILNKLNIHKNIPNPEKFRNPNGVSLKLSNFKALDPNYTGKGMNSYSALDKKIWDEFHKNGENLKLEAMRILKSIPNVTILEAETKLASEEQSLKETHNNSIRTVFHKNKYNLFVDYCDKKGYNKISDLVSFDFNRLYEIPGLGVRKISDIINIAIRLINSTEKINSDNFISNQTKYPKTKYEVKCISGDMLIKDFFSDGIYNLFVNHCTRSRLYVLNDLMDYCFDDLKKINGIGYKKIQLIKKKFYSYKKQCKINTTTNENLKSNENDDQLLSDSLFVFPLFSAINDLSGDIITDFEDKVNDPLNNLGLSQRALHVIQIAKLERIIELLMLPEFKLLRYKNCGKLTVTEFKNKITKYLMEQDKDHSSQWDSFDSMIKDLIKIKDRDLHIFKNRLGINHPEPQTLEDSGYGYGLTRERTRQIITNIYKKLNSKVNKKLLEPFWLGMDLILDKYNGYVFGSDIVDDLCDLMNWNNKIEGHAIIEFSKLYYKYLIDDELTIIALKSKTCTRCKYKKIFFNSFKDDLDEFTYEELKQKLKLFCTINCECFNDSLVISAGQIAFMLADIDYSTYFKSYENKFISFEKYTEIKKIEIRNRLRNNNSPLILLEDYLEELEEPLTNDEILIFFRKIGIEVNYYLGSLIQNSEYLYSWGRGSVIHKKNVHITSNLLQIISDFIYNNIDNQFHSIVVQKVYDQFAQECSYEDIPDQIALYSALSLKLTDSFHFPGYPIISKSNEIDISLSSLVEMYIANFNNGISYDEARDFLTNEMGMRVRTFRFQVRNNDSIVKINDDLLIHKKYLISETEDNVINTIAELLLACKNLSSYALKTHLDSINIALPQNVSIDSIISGNQNIEQKNGVYMLKDSSRYYGLLKHELLEKLYEFQKNLDFDRQDKEYLKNYFSNESRLENKFDNNNPLDDILDEFGE